jgi:Protein of unknown function (DUF2911)
MPQAIMRLARLSAIAAVVACARSGAVSSSPGGIAPSAGNERGAFVVTLGTDTVTVEQYHRAGNRIEGDIIQRQPMTTIGHYVIALNADGTPERVEYAVRRPDGSLPPNAPRSVTVLYGPDTVTTQVMRDSTITTKVAAKGAFPYFNNAFGPYELWLSRLRATRTDTATIPLLTVGSRNAPNPFSVRFLGGDTVRVWYFGSPQYVRFDREGRIQSVDATQTTVKVSTRRQPSVDIQSIAGAFAAAEAAGRGFGTSASLRDTARAPIAGATISVDYGRPALRGRDVWQRGVLGDTIWRTGANAATEFTTSADLLMNGQTIPAGKYTLWTHTTSSGSYELIFNKQTGQWGTIYNAQQDLVRVPLQVSSLPSPVDRFTITVESQASGGALRLAWGTKQLSVPFTVKP